MRRSTAPRRGGPWDAHLLRMTLTEAKQDLLGFVNRVATGPGVVVTYRRQPLAAFLTVQAYERLRRRLGRARGR